jgi:primosomal protein N' (replication factor Y)
VPIVLGSATPSLETLQNVRPAGSRGCRCRAARARRCRRARAVIDLREHAVRAGHRDAGGRSHAAASRDGGQVLVYINRRGYSPTLACTACGWIAPCRDCDARLTVHLGRARLRCHHCGADAPLPRTCPQCGYAVRTWARAPSASRRR